MVNHLSRLHVSSRGDISDSFPDEHHLAVYSNAPWFAHIINFLVTTLFPEHWNRHKKDKFFHELKYYFWEEPLLFHVRYNQIIRMMCCGGRTRRYIIDVSLISMWRTLCHLKDSRQDFTKQFLLAHHLQGCHHFYTECLQCQTTLKISKRDEMPMRSILEVEIYDLWGIDFMGPFSPSDGKEYILVAVDYVSKWVEAIPIKINTHRKVLKFVTRNIFSWYDCLRAIISDGGSHFNNAHFCALLKKYGVHHRVITLYHPQANG